MIDNFINTLHAPIQLTPRNCLPREYARSRAWNNLRFKRALRVFSRSSQLAITFLVDTADF